MDRGHAEYLEMKGFELEVKGASDDEGGGGADVADHEKLNDKMRGRKAPKKGETTFLDDDYDIAPELQLVEDGAKRDIESGYVSDVQGERVGKKGFETYNELCTKGVAADLSVDPYDVTGSLNRIAEHHGVVAKELDEGVVIGKGGGEALLRKFGSVSEGPGLLKRGVEAVKRGAEAVRGAGRAVAGTPERIGRSAEEKLRSGTSLGNDVGSRGKRARRAAADVVGSHKKAVGGAALGAGGLAAAGGIRAATKEEKCASGMKTKGAFSEGAKKVGEAVVGAGRTALGKIGEGAAAVGRRVPMTRATESEFAHQGAEAAKKSRNAVTARQVKKAQEAEEGVGQAISRRDKRVGGAVLGAGGLGAVGTGAALSHKKD